ncbi:Amastin surface glycoprotein, putative [Leishmania guyanensis]
MEFNPFIIVYAAIQFIAFLLVVVGTALDMFRLQSRENFEDRPCITLWGLKPYCNSIVYSLSSDERFSLCPVRRKRFHMAQILAVVSVGVYGTAFALGVIMLYCCLHLRWVCLLLNIVGFVILPIPLALMVLSYKTDENSLCPKLRDDYDFGLVFYIFATAVGMDFIDIVFLLIPWQYDYLDVTCNSKEGNSQEE